VASFALGTYGGAAQHLRLHFGNFGVLLQEVSDRVETTTKKGGGNGKRRY